MKPLIIIKDWDATLLKRCQDCGCSVRSPNDWDEACLECERRGSFNAGAAAMFRAVIKKIEEEATITNFEVILSTVTWEKLKGER
jgi:hypothetical protein